MATPTVDKEREYQRMFRFDGQQFSHIDIFMHHYKSLNAIQTRLGEECINFIPKDDMEKTLEDGVALFSDDRKFRSFIEAFKGYIGEFMAFYEENIEPSETISREDFERFKDLARRIFYFSSKTEFIYLDKAHGLAHGNPSIRRNMKELYDLKAWYRENLMNQMFLGKECQFNRMMRKLSRQFNIRYEDLIEHGMDEISGLYDNKEVDPDLIRQRREAILAVGEGDRVSYVFGDRAKSDIRWLAGEDGQAKTLHQGITASPGKARGKVKIILGDFSNYDLRAQEFAKMDKGDILVAETTSPDLMPACRKASAILTDQGGLLSHAAVVSREFGIPCVVGLNNLTKTLKDGDIVEVDADKGTVRKVE